MPLYEFRCNRCHRVFGLLVRSFQHEVAASCPRCGSTNVRRLVSRFAVLRSEESRADELADVATDMGDLDENDPRSIARWARRMKNEIGEDVGPEFDEMVDRLEAGESPESIEQSLGGALPGGGEAETLE